MIGLFHVKLEVDFGGLVCVSGCGGGRRRRLDKGVKIFLCEFRNSEVLLHIQIHSNVGHCGRHGQKRINKVEFLYIKK